MKQLSVFFNSKIDCFIKKIILVEALKQPTYIKL